MKHSPERDDLSRAQRRRRSDILDAALQIFDRDGYDAARMSDIAEAADVAKGTLYLYFENKEALLFEVVKAVVSPLLEEAFGSKPGQKISCADHLKHQLRTMATRVSQGDMKIVLKLMISMGSKQKHLAKFYFDTVYAPGMQAIEMVLKEGVSTGEFRAEAAGFAPHILTGPAFLIGVRDILFEDLDHVEIGKIVEDQINMVMSGLLC